MSYSYSWLGLPVSVFRNERVVESEGESGSGRVEEGVGREWSERQRVAANSTYFSMLPLSLSKRKLFKLS